MDQTDKMRKRNFFFQNGGHRARAQSQDYYSIIRSNKNRVEILEHVTVIRGHNYARLPKLGSFFNRRLTLRRSESNFGDLLDELSHMANTDFFRKKLKLHVFFEISYLIDIKPVCKPLLFEIKAPESKL